VDAHGMPLRVTITSGTRADCSEAKNLIGDLKGEYLLGDKGYDSMEIIELAENREMVPVIPPRKNRKDQRQYDEYLYKMRHLVENGFMRFKEWRGIATRYAKRSKSFLAAVQIRCLFWWLKIS
jgi:transposase